MPLSLKSVILYLTLFILIILVFFKYSFENIEPYEIKDYDEIGKQENNISINYEKANKLKVAIEENISLPNVSKMSVEDFYKEKNIKKLPEVSEIILGMRENEFWKMKAFWENYLSYYIPNVLDGYSSMYNQIADNEFRDKRLAEIQTLRDMYNSGEMEKVATDYEYYKKNRQSLNKIFKKQGIDIFKHIASNAPKKYLVNRMKKYPYFRDITEEAFDYSMYENKINNNIYEKPKNIKSVTLKPIR